MLLGPMPTAGLRPPTGLRPPLGLRLPKYPDPGEVAGPCPLLGPAGRSGRNSMLELREEDFSRFLVCDFDGPGVSSGELMALWKRFEG